ncbi:MAG TPA: dihydropteroate synthase, partial [Tepidisphaeraceae bacterium]|nr:dihydropteroate synthase [Tepidisphaeraceae bacterium]
EEGAAIIDIGGESTRPGALPVESAEQIRRLVPALEKIAAMNLPAVISVDTAQSSVAQAALDAGAHIINDVSAGRDDARIFSLAAKRRCPIILMHMLGRPRTMQNNPVYSDVVSEVKDFLIQRVQAARQEGVAENQIVIDPGIGFGKTAEHDLALLRELHSFSQLGRAVMVGVSRKKFIGRITGEPEPGQRVLGTAATVAWSITNGADIVRVHDVRAMSQVVKMIAAIQAGTG